MSDILKIHDVVRVYNPGSWTHGQVMTVKKLNVSCYEGFIGHSLQADGCVTIVPADCLELASGNEGCGRGD